MIFLNNEQNKNWGEIKQILEENDIQFSALEQGIKKSDLDLAVLAANSIIEEVREIENEKTGKRWMHLIALMAVRNGFPEKVFGVTIKKNPPEDYGQNYSLELELEPSILPYLTEENGVEEIYEDWVEEEMDDVTYEFDCSDISINQEKIIEIPLPTLKGTYTF